MLRVFLDTGGQTCHLPSVGTTGTTSHRVSMSRAFRSMCGGRNGVRQGWRMASEEEEALVVTDEEHQTALVYQES